MSRVSKKQNRNNQLLQAVFRSDSECVQKLIESKADINCKDYNGNTPLHLSLENSLGMYNLLLSYPHIKTEITNNYGQTPLNYAAESGNTAGMKALIEKKVNVNTQDSKGDCPLTWMVYTQDTPGSNKRYEMIKLLLEHKADPSLKNKSGKSPLDYALNRNNTQVVKTLVDKHPVNHDELIYAIKRDDTSKAIQLIIAGADLDYRDENGISIKDYVERRKNVSLMACMNMEKRKVE